VATDPKDVGPQDYLVLTLKAQFADSPHLPS